LLAPFSIAGIVLLMPFPCPNCGAEVENNALSCSECGSDERTGWSDDTIYDGLDLPDDAFDENSSSEGFKPRRNDLLLAGVALIVLVLFVLRFVF
tara:strand:+ start:2631 stop:2915 length:285 start_codon:yes stop_codon:yes gene_type:complete